jgi:hypothetical protein
MSSTARPLRDIGGGSSTANDLTATRAVSDYEDYPGLSSRWFAGAIEQSLIGPGEEDDLHHKLGSHLMHAGLTETILVASFAAQCERCFQSAMECGAFRGKAR